MNTLLAIELAKKNQQIAWDIIHKTGIEEIWQSIGAQINLVGSLKMGLLVNHRDIDFHIYSKPINLHDSFSAIEQLANNPCIKHIEFSNLLNTQEECLEWHAFYQDEELWQIDMIHILEGSKYDGYFEKMAQRINEVLNDETRNTILSLKYATPKEEKIMGIEYYQAVLRDNVRTNEEFMQWRKDNPVNGVLEWIP